MKLPIIIHKDPDSDYSVTVPDLLGCYSAGSTIEEAMLMAKEAIECHLEGMFLDGENMPLISPIEKHKENLEYNDGIWGLVDIDISALSIASKQINITMPENILHNIDKYAKNHGQTRSGLFTQAVTEYITNHH